MQYAPYRDTVRNQLAVLEKAQAEVKNNHKKPKTPTYNMTKEQLHQYKVDAYKHEEAEFQKVKDAMMKVATEVILNASYLVLHDNFGFGNSRLQEYQNLVEKQLDCIISGHISLEDLKEVRNDLNRKCKYVGVDKGNESIIVKQVSK